MHLNLCTVSQTQKYNFAAHVVGSKVESTTLEMSLVSLYLSLSFPYPPYIHTQACTPTHIHWTMRES